MNRFALSHPEDGEEVRTSVLSRRRPLLKRGSTLYAGKGLELHSSEDGGDTFSKVTRCRVCVLQRWPSRVRLLARIGRLGFHALRSLPGGGMVGIIRGHIVHRGRENGAFRSVFRFPRGSRPLSLDVDGDGRIVFGEYFSNPERESVHIYASRDGTSWERIHSFPAGTVRHIHGVRWDPFRKGWWLLTGDEDEESGLWFTDDFFGTLRPVVRGHQHARAVAVIPDPGGLIVPTDSPRIQNRIQFLDPERGRLEALCSLPGSAFHAIKDGDLYLVSTVGEPSEVNSEDGATIFASLDGRRWARIASFAPDILARSWPAARRVFRYPELALVPGDGDGPYVFGFGRSVAGADGRLVRWSRDEIRKTLERRLSVDA